MAKDDRARQSAGLTASEWDRLKKSPYRLTRDVANESPSDLLRRLEDSAAGGCALAILDRLLTTRAVADARAAIQADAARCFAETFTREPFPADE